MKISPAIVGARVGPRHQEIDARWLMAYAAGLGEAALEYLDTTRPDGPTAHPLFPVCYEWAATLALAVSAVLAREPAGAAARVTRVAGRFSTMVGLPSAISVHGRRLTEGPEGRAVDFQVRSGGGVAVKDGRVVLRGDATPRGGT
jgi:hypothetical protein